MSHNPPARRAATRLGVSWLWTGQQRTHTQRCEHTTAQDNTRQHKTAHDSTRQHHTTPHNKRQHKTCTTPHTHTHKTTSIHHQRSAQVTLHPYTPLTATQPPVSCLPFFSNRRKKASDSLKRVNQRTSRKPFLVQS